MIFLFFFFNDTATTEIYTLSLHDALPIYPVFGRVRVEHYNNAERMGRAAARSMLGSTAPYDYIHSFWSDQDRKSTRLNSSHLVISYAVFCLKKKKASQPLLLCVLSARRLA